uniref:Uncharacterized protein n=1 Tax=Dulem virus 201 TaxID=3145678 RepID=A0AAU8B103_9VIRU
MENIKKTIRTKTAKFIHELIYAIGLIIIGIILTDCIDTYMIVKGINNEVKIKKETSNDIKVDSVTTKINTGK